MNADPNALPDPNDPPAPPEPQPEPPAPQIGLDQAYDIIAQQEGWDPRLTRYEIQEHKRRVQEFEREKREFEQRQSRQHQPPEDNGDPYMRRISGLERVILEEREERRKEREQQQLVASLGNELHSAYTGLARQSGLTKEQMEQRSEDFYDTLNDLYPDPTMLRQIGVERAARAAFRLLGGNGPRQPQPYINGRGLTASRVIPGAVSQSQAPVQDDGGPQRPGESLEDYVMRRRRWREENNVTPVVRDGQRYSSE